MISTKSIRIASKSSKKAVTFVKCGFSEVSYWKKKIQPAIKSLNIIGSDWNWTGLYLKCRFIELLNLRRCEVYQVCVENAEGAAVPVAQMIITHGYYFPGDKSKKCVFVWFIARAPGNVLKTLGVMESLSVLPTVISFAIELSKEKGFEGRIGLHAAEGTADQSEQLLAKYLELGLQPRPEGKGYFRFPHRGEDGRLLYLDEGGAQAFLQKNCDLL